MTQVIDNIFSNVSYWQDKKLLLQAIRSDFYNDKNMIVKLLGISSALVSPSNEAKKDMWNHQINKYNMGDDILRNVNPDILKDFDFAKMAIAKYNRTYIFLDKSLQASKELAALASRYETDEHPHNNPILEYMPEIFRNDGEISIMATTRNLENLRLAKLLQNNKYFIVDMINFIYEDDKRYKVLEYINQDLLNDKRFVSKLGCFDGLCEKFRGDVVFVSYTVINDIEILSKVKIFDEQIVAAGFKNKTYHENPQYILSKIFKYIERFNDDFEELETKIKDKKLLYRLFWELGQMATEDFI